MNAQNVRICEIRGKERVTKLDRLRLTPDNYSNIGLSVILCLASFAVE